MPLVITYISYNFDYVYNSCICGDLCILNRCACVVYIDFATRVIYGS